MYVHWKVQNYSVKNLFLLCRNLGYGVTRTGTLYAQEDFLALCCLDTASQSPVVRKVVMSMLLWSRRRFEGLQENKIPKGERSGVSRVAVCQNSTPASAGTSRLHVALLFICKVYLPWSLHLLKLAAARTLCNHLVSVLPFSTHDCFLNYWKLCQWRA